MPIVPAIRKRDADPRPRPRFDLLVTLTPEEVFEGISSAIHASDKVRGVALDEQRFEIIRDDRTWRMWAPQLDVKIVPEEDGTKIMGRFGPHPHVWMAYTSLYFTAAFFAVACATYGVVQWMLDEQPWALYLTPIAFLGAGLVYGASYVGQGLATSQMFELREFLERSVEASTTSRRAAAAP